MEEKRAALEGDNPEHYDNEDEDNPALDGDDKIDAKPEGKY